jgi:hypothetical protein
MFDFCQYKNSLGIPNQGVHSYRFMDLAIVDVLLTVLAAYVISLYTKYSFWIILLALFLSGIILHRLFCVRTTIDKALFTDEK